MLMLDRCKVKLLRKYKLEKVSVLSNCELKKRDERKVAVEDDKVSNAGLTNQVVRSAYSL